MRLLEIDKSKVKCIFLSTIRIDETKVSFDIMNNPKASKRDFYRQGSIAKRVGASNLFKWEELKIHDWEFCTIPMLIGKVYDIFNLSIIIKMRNGISY